MLAVASALPWIGQSWAQTAPQMDCTWTGTCGSQRPQADPKAEELRRRQLEEQRRKAEEQRRLEEERRRADEQRRLEEERRRTDEQRRLEEERRRADEQRLLEEEQRRTDEQRRLEEEQRRRADEQRRLEEEQRRRADEQRRLEEEQRRRADEQRRLEEEQRRADEQRRLEEERRRTDEQRRLEEEQRRQADEQRRLEEERRRVEEERRRTGEDQRNADRKRQEGELLAALRRGDPNDVLLFLNETTSAPNASRNPQGVATFRGGQAAVCGVTPWTGGPEVTAALEAVLARHGVSRVLTNVAEKACPETARPYDVIAVERRQFLELSAANVRALITDILDRRLTPLEPGVTAADIAAARERNRPPLSERRRLLGPTVNPLAERLVAEVRAYIAAEGRSGSVGTEFAAFGHWYGELRGGSRSPDVERYEIDDYGDATGTGGSLPAASVVVWFNVTTPGRATPQQDCMVFAWLDDAATGLRREPIAFRCDAVSEIDQWKRQRGLRSKWT